MAGNATGERIKGSVQRQIIQMAIEGHTINQIATAANVQWETAKAIITRESKPIGERKLELANATMRIAVKTAERLEDELDTIPTRNLPILFGIMTDKVIALTQEPANQINQHLHVHLNPSNIMEQFNDLVTKINAPAMLESAHTVVDCVSDATVSLIESAQQKQKESEQVPE